MADGKKPQPIFPDEGIVQDAVAMLEWSRRNYPCPGCNGTGEVAIGKVVPCPATCRLCRGTGINPAYDGHRV